jgi:hypothetical protein
MTDKKYKSVYFYEKDVYICTKIMPTNTTNKSLNEVFQTLRDLVKSPGYLYVLLFMIEEDICIPFSQLKDADPQIRLSMKEAAMLVGLFINENNDVLKEPNNIDSLLDLRAKTYQVLDELHWAMTEPLAKEMREAVNLYMGDSKQQFSPNQILAHAIHMRETFFYSNEPAYDLEYLFFAPSKYKYDEEWLLRNKGFDIGEAVNIAIVIKNLFDSKMCKISSLSKEQINEMISNDRRLRKDKTSAERTRIFLTLQKFEDLLLTEVDDDHDYIECIDCHKLCQILLDLFMIEKSVIEKLNGIRPFLDNFSTEIYPGINSDFTEPGKSNVVTWKPILKVEEDRYILPLPYLLFQSIYETPYYWLMEDKHYVKTAGSHLGDAGEDIVFDFLKPIFGEDMAFKNVIIKKGHNTITDIDIFCLLGNKALCVQVKSKKLTEKAQTGDDSAYHNDFKGAIADAYKQGMTCRDSILKNDAVLYNSHGEIIETHDIDDVYIMCVTTGYYSAIPHQVHLLLDLEDKATAPVVLNIFDLHLLSYYLKDPYEFLYYVRQRIATYKYYIANNETILLSYHLSDKLWKDPEMSSVLLDSSIAEDIDVDYPNIFNIDLNPIIKREPLSCKWLNHDYQSFLSEIKEWSNPHVTDVLFHLYDCSTESERLLGMISNAKKRSREKHTIVSTNMVFEHGTLGISYIASYTQDINTLMNEMTIYSHSHKYKAKADKWIGFASSIYSPFSVDTIEYNTTPWEKDPKVEEDIKLLDSSVSHLFAEVPNKKKIGRNEPCPCGSGLKYKKCHGKK